MSDNITSQAVTTPGAVFASDEIGGVHHPRVKVEIGADGSATDVSSTNPMPVRLNDGSANLDVASLDYDSDTGVSNRVAVGLIIPGVGGPVIAGTDANPLRIDPTGDTPQIVRAVANHDQPAAGVEPFIAAGRANDAPTNEQVSPGDISYLWTDAFGRLVTVPFVPAQGIQATVRGPAPFTISAGGDTTLIAAPPSGYAIHVTEITATNYDGAVDTILSFKSDGGSVAVTSFLPKTGLFPFRMSFNPPWKLETDTALVGNLFAGATCLGTIHFYVER